MDVNRVFSYHPANADDVKDMHEAVRLQCGAIAQHWLNHLPDCHEKDRALDALDDAMKHANAAIARELSYKP
jgi:hypothetical protein